MINYKYWIESVIVEMECFFGVVIYSYGMW